MILDNQMILTDESGKEVKCTVVANFTIDDKNYIAYTDGTVSDDGEELFVSRYKVKDGTLELMEIKDEYEWDKVDTYLDEYLFEEDDL